MLWQETNSFEVDQTYQHFQLLDCPLSFDLIHRPGILMILEYALFRMYPAKFSLEGVLHPLNVTSTDKKKLKRKNKEKNRFFFNIKEKKIDSLN